MFHAYVCHGLWSRLTRAIQHWFLVLKEKKRWYICWNSKTHPIKGCYATIWYQEEIEYLMNRWPVGIREKGIVMIRSWHRCYHHHDEHHTSCAWNCIFLVLLVHADRPLHRWAISENNNTNLDFSQTLCSQRSSDDYLNRSPKQFMYKVELSSLELLDTTTQASCLHLMQEANINTLHILSSLSLTHRLSLSSSSLSLYKPQGEGKVREEEEGVKEIIIEKKTMEIKWRWWPQGI